MSLLVKLSSYRRGRGALLFFLPSPPPPTQEQFITSCSHSLSLVFPFSLNFSRYSCPYLQVYQDPPPSRPPSSPPPLSQLPHTQHGQTKLLRSPETWKLVLLRVALLRHTESINSMGLPWACTLAGTSTHAHSHNKNCPKARLLHCLYI